MQIDQIQNALLFELVPAFCRGVREAEDIENLKEPSLQLMRELQQMVFGGQKVELIEHPQDHFNEESKDNFDQIVNDDLKRYREASGQVLTHLQAEVQQVRSYSQFLNNKKSEMLSPRVGRIAKAHVDSLEPQIEKLTDDIQKIHQMKNVMAGKIGKLLDEGIADLISQPYSALPIPKLSVNIKQLKHRFTEDYLPAKKKLQDFVSPAVAMLSYEKYIIGVGDCGNLQFYFIFNDKTQTIIDKSGIKSQFKETFIQPEGSIVKTIRVQFFNNYSDQADGSFSGVQFLDKTGEVILSAGLVNNKASMYSIQEYDLAEGERIIGIKSGLRDKGSARHWDLQFVVGRQE